MQTQTRAAYEVIPSHVNNDIGKLVQHQCSWCGVLMGGPLEGLFPTTPEGLVAILGGTYIVQDQCASCHETYDEVRF